MKKKNAKEYLADFLKIAPLSHALWRAVEALSFNEVEFKSPVLDLGCGFGEFAGVVFDRVETGIDVDEKELERAIKGGKYKNLQWADARKLPFRSRSYATVVSVSVLEHITDCEEVISEVHRILKKDGLFVFSVPTDKLKEGLMVPKLFELIGLGKYGDKYFKLHSRAFKHVNLKSINWWVEKLEEAGFEIVEKHGTISRTILRMHELFLVSAFPSQFWKLFFGERLIMMPGIRSSVLSVFFSKFVYTDKDSNFNMFFVARKK